MEAVNDALDIGQLVDMQWKLGVALTSDTCKHLNAPYITMTLKVANASGQVTSHTFEMTVTQFQEFSRQMKDMAASMESV